MNRPCITAGLCLEAVYMHWMCCARIRGSQHRCARSAAGCVLRGENAALSAGAGVEHIHHPRASTRRSDAQQEARGTGPSYASYPACPMLQGAESGCWTALPRVAKPSRGCMMVRRASHREHAKTARPAVRWHRLGVWPARTGVPGAPARREGGETAGLQGMGWVLCFCVFGWLPKNQLVPGDGFQLAAKGCGIRNKGQTNSTLQ